MSQESLSYTEQTLSRDWFSVFLQQLWLLSWRILGKLEKPVYAS